MFRDTRRKKLRNRLLVTALGACVLALGIWLNYSVISDEDGSEEAAKNVKVEQTEDGAEGDASGDSEDSGEDTDAEDTGNVTYLVREEDGVVEVFSCRGGEEELYLVTSIPYDLLSESDQQMFVEGVSLDTEEELGEFLESFDS